MPSTFRRFVTRLGTPAGERPPAVGALALFVAILGVMALVAPLRAAEQPLERVGVLLLLGGLLETQRALRRAAPSAIRRAVASGAITLAMGLVVVSAPLLAGTALVLFLGLSFATDGLGYAGTAWRTTDRRARERALLAAAGNAAVVVLLVATRHVSVTWLVALGGALRLFGVAWTIATTTAYVARDAGRSAVDDLEIENRDAATALERELAAEEPARRARDIRWTIAFLVTLFAIHNARMQTDRSLLGYLSPTIALTGDMVLAVLFAIAVIGPLAVSARRSTRWIERRAWRWYLPADGRAPVERGWRGAVVGAWLRYRLRVGMRLRAARFSTPAALGLALATGIPAAAVVAATVPVWGMSWFFDTENWASGIWNSWAESRTDEWRAAMVHAIAGAEPGVDPATFAVTPPGTSAGDFSFVVIGDTGEGDASQHALRDNLLAVAARDDVRFVVISSDVVYPNGSMTDYEAKFWLPFKGVTKPVYAIPGNHDWYDALEAFLATFLEPDAARAAMRARADADLRLTSTTTARIDGLIAEAARLRREYGVPTGYQRGPFFEFQTDGFALVAIDTGIVKRIDDAQWAWLERALDRARGKTTMAVVGHPFYAGGADETEEHDDFAKLKRLLVEHGASILMAGDTHDLEYYFDPPAAGAPAVHYFVNGGGGAYMSFGTALAWPATAPTARWAYYPDRAAVVAKIRARSPWWKLPAWWWTDRVGAWPFSAEWMSAAFDYNVAPFFQSFIEVRVERSAHRIRLLPYGVHGRLRWSDLAHSPGLPPTGAGELVEWIISS